MRLSAVILSFNSQRFLARSVEALVAALGQQPEGDEIFVVENGSSDGSVELLRELEARHAGLVKGIYCPRNTGTTVSRNLALARAAGRYLLVLDSDVTAIPQETLPHLMAVLDNHPKAGIVVPRLVYGSGREQLSTDRFPTIGHKLRRFFRLKAMEARLSPAEATRPREVDYAISAFWLMRSEAFRHVGPLDERIFYSPEDVDYCLRVWQAGFSVRYEPAVYAVHDAQEISRGFKMAGFTLRHAKGLAYLFWKHGYAFGLGRLYRRLGREQGTPT